jgi:predicted RNase H-like nuclease
MNFIGVDLAWGERNGTGLCVLSEGKVVDSARRRAMDDIVAWLLPYTTGACIVAIDAPLIVRNVTGRRPCEQLISRCFSRYHASAHSSNLTNPSFRAGVRAMELADRLDLETTPEFGHEQTLRRAIEVYPHTALVALFDLPLTLKYKAKRGRTVEGRRDEFASCMALIESLSSADPRIDVHESERWTELTAEIASAPTGAALDRAEDEMDAYICAYVGLYYWAHGLSRSRVVGDVETGYIVTPVSPEQAAWLDAASGNA